MGSTLESCQILTVVRVCVARLGMSLRLTQAFEWAGKFGSAADYMRTTGEVPQGTRFVSGVRFWF